MVNFTKATEGDDHRAKRYVKELKMLKKNYKYMQSEARDQKALVRKVESHLDRLDEDEDSSKHRAYSRKLKEEEAKLKDMVYDLKEMKVRAAKLTAWLESKGHSIK